MCKDFVLALETSSPQGGVAISDLDGVVKFTEIFISDKRHHSQLFAPLQRALEWIHEEERGGGQLRGIVVGSGPGSYTGARIALSAGISLSLALGVPVVAWPSVTTLSRERHYTVILDARRGFLAGMEVATGKVVGETKITDDMKAFEAWLSTQGTGSLSMWTMDEVSKFESYPWANEIQSVQPDVVLLSQLAASWNEQDWEERANLPVEPFYLMPPFVTKSQKKAPLGR